MRITAFVMLCLWGSLAWADEEAETETRTVDTVDLRVSVLENIDVTSDKKSLAIFAEEEDEDIDTILEEAEALEEESEAE